MITKPSNRFLRFLMACLSWASLNCAHAQINVQKTTTRAVVVGISNYENIASLRFAHKDAEAFAEYLRSPAGGNVPKENIKLLTNEKATDAQIGGALYWLLGESQEGDQAIIFFSGHGDVETVRKSSGSDLSDASAENAGKIPSAKTMGYLLAYNANKFTYMVGGAVPITTIEWVVTSLTEVKLAQVLLIADACHAGNLAGSAIGGSKLTALALSTQFDNEVKILSCGADQVSNEGEDWGGGHSVFSYYLLEGLRGLADKDEDRRVSLREIEGFLVDSVRRATIQLDRRQTPETFGNRERIVAKVDAATLAALKQKYSPPKADLAPAVQLRSPASDSAVLKLYEDFEVALRTGHLLEPEAGSAYTIYQQIKDHPAMRSYKNLIRNDLAAKLQDETQKAINDYLSADPREMRRRWGLDDGRYRLYPLYLDKAAELLGEQNISYKTIKAKQFYFEGLNLRLRGERSSKPFEKDSCYSVARMLHEKTIGLDSTAAYAYNELGLLARRKDNYALSIEHFNNAVKYSPTWVLPWANLCGSYNELGKVESAEICGLKAVSLSDDLALSQYNLGYVYWIKGEKEKAAYHFQKTIENSTEYANAYFNMGLYYCYKDQYHQAENMFIEYTKRVPEDPDGYQNLGEVAQKLGKTTISESYFFKAIELNSNYNQAYLGLSELYLSNKDIVKSDAWFKKFSALSPDDPKGYYYLANRHYQNPTLALKYLESAFQKGFNDYDRLVKEERLSALRRKNEYEKLIKKYFPNKI